MKPRNMALTTSRVAVLRWQVESGHQWASLAIFLLAGLMLGFGSPGQAEAGEWSLRFEPMQMTVSGHDQPVLKVRQLDLAAPPTTSHSEAVILESEDDLAFRFGAEYRRGRWRYGVDLLWFVSRQDAPNQRASASDSDHPVSFEVADRVFSSTTSGEMLFYGVLEDTELAAWTTDLYAMRALVEDEGGRLFVKVGLRNADFDNDYRAVVGLESAGGRRLDASSNYGRMMGPMVGLAAEIIWGRHRFDASLAQAIVFGEAELSNRSREFAGALDQAFEVEAPLPTTFEEKTFHAIEDVAVPMTELRLGWSVDVGAHFSIGATAEGSLWWDVPVPPGILPGPGADEDLLENTLLFFGLAVAAEIRF